MKGAEGAPTAGYYLNPQFQFGLEHGSNVAWETLDGATKLLLFWDKSQSFGSPQAQKAWSKMNPGTAYPVVGVKVAPATEEVAIFVEDGKEVLFRPCLWLRCLAPRMTSLACGPQFESEEEEDLEELPIPDVYESDDDQVSMF
ncbi:hypothetical protein RIF29_15434 [Crotalaria pallida]|uniref:Uncharacterized protein n=1 Tax=Crotalaria pallida TaxID=3830 RepID=A0AAN9FDJ0_CROPI